MLSEALSSQTKGSKGFGRLVELLSGLKPIRTVQLDRTRGASLVAQLQIEFGVFRKETLSLYSAAVCVRLKAREFACLYVY